MRREFEEERLRLQEERKKGGHTAQRAANVGPLQSTLQLMHLSIWNLQFCNNSAPSG